MTMTNAAPNPTDRLHPEDGRKGGPAAYVPGMHPGTVKRNVIVLIVYVLGTLVVLGVLQRLVAATV